LAFLASLLSIASVAHSQVSREVMDSDVDRAIGELKRYVYGLQLPDGSWPNAGDSRRAVSYDVPGGGGTALAVFALLEAGESPTKTELKAGLDVLAKIPRENLARASYVISFRVMVFSQLLAQSKDSPYREVLKKDLEWLLRKEGPVTAAHAGAWGYSGPELAGDNSCSQIALLALWEADLAGLEIDSALLAQVEQTWIRRQRKDGGWMYAGLPDSNGISTPSMTSAALASLYVTRDVLSLSSGPYRHQKKLDAGWGWLEKGLDANFVRDGYLAFCVQRVGMATGRKFIGPLDWFAGGAGILCAPDPQGRRFGGYQYGPLIQACFELVFLSRGRWPITFNKLQYGTEQNWNFHNRDVARFTEYMRRTFEARLRWQTVDVAGDVQPLLDAPLLLVEGATPPALTPEQWNKLREYSLRGGTIVFLANNSARPFADAVRKDLEKLYAEPARLAGGNYKLRPLGEDHPIYSLYGEKISRGHQFAPAWGVSDGTRELAIVCERDIAVAWQKRSRATGKQDYQIGTNLFLYATGYNPARTRLRPVFAVAGRQAAAKVKIAWLAHGGNWYTQPYALDYLSQKLVAENRLAIDVQVGAPIEAGALRGAHLAWMTGTGAFQLTERETADLRAYLEGGGMLFLNAVGGSREFRDSAQALLTKLTDGWTVTTWTTPPASSPLASGKVGDYRGPDLYAAPMARTRQWQNVDPSAKGIQLRGVEKDGRVIAALAPFGIHDTLDGHTGHGALSYLPGSAADIAENIVLYGFAGKAAASSAASSPTDSPAAPATAPAGR